MNTAKPDKPDMLDLGFYKTEIPKPNWKKIGHCLCFASTGLSAALGYATLGPIGAVVLGVIHLVGVYLALDDKPDVLPPVA